MTRPAFRLAVSLAMALAIGACGSSVPSVSPAASVGASTNPAPSSSTEASEPAGLPSAEATPVASAGGEEGQTETEWGRIWDAPPAGLPVFPAATLSEEAATGPATAVYVVEGAKPAALATWYQDAFSTAGFFTNSLSGPFEDGGYILEATGDDPACRVSMTIAPLGGTVSLTLLYGAACPHP